MLKGTVTSIGKQAISQKDPMVILFGETATEDLREVSVVQALPEHTTFDLHQGDKLSFDEQEYQVDYLGELANNNLTAIGHVTLVFANKPDVDALENAVYLTPHELPTLEIGTEIRYGE